jgi:predicted patatin/cPLA2 family phospholipase
MTNRLFGKMAALAALLALAACAQTLVRNPVPAPMVGEALPLGMTGLRFWGDTLSHEEVATLIAGRGAVLRARFASNSSPEKLPELYYLALSGGGQWGAFGAGILNAWTESGTRPVFAGVSGISTGALIAPFAFLGPKYDPVLTKVYSTYSTDDLLEPTLLSGLISGTALSDTAPLARIIAENITPEFIADVAEEHRKGRVLLVGTTNLDSGRPVIWNLGAIAASGHPGALDLFRKVVLASASIPVAFPPVLIPVTGPDGKTYDEMHVDGGATSQVTFVSPSVPIRELTEEALGRNLPRHLYVIMNTDLIPPYGPIEPRINKIGGASIASLIRGSGIGDLYKLYLVAGRDDIDYSVGWVPSDIPCETPVETFDPVFMRCLYGVGENLLRTGVLWRDLPPYYVTGIR